MLIRNIFVVVISFVSFTASSIETDNRAIVDQAVSAHDGGDYERAVAIYEGLLNQNLVNGHVYYNLGNAFYRLGKKGEATAAYLAAKKFLPRDPDIVANLKHTRKSALDKLEASWPTLGN